MSLYTTCPLCGDERILKFEVDSGEHRILSNWIDSHSQMWRCIECRVDGAKHSTWFCVQTGEQSVEFPGLKQPA